MKKYTTIGVLIACTIIFIWFVCLVFGLNYQINHFYDPIIYLLILSQSHLFTGLFITAHDAMHGSLAPQTPKLNNFIGRICTLLFAMFWYPSLYKKHHLHHQHVHTAEDPDYYQGGFWTWYFKFLTHYITWYQLLAMACIFNILEAYFHTLNLLIFWVLPSIISTLQLFYFGTWQPHHGEHQNKHHSRTLRKNHLWAFVSCYFFGYHYEHHDQPQLPWWKLHQLKNDNLTKE